MTEPSRAVFLSYASQDAGPARRICEALRAAGIEVWFDQSELRGGDAWDQSIRRQIKTCALFIAVVSRHTHDRAEGYFRLEWKLAVDRSHLIVANKAFLLPVVVDDLNEDDENVPDRFKEVQWTRLPGGETPAEFVGRVQRLLSGESPLAPNRTGASGSPAATAAPTAFRPKRRSQAVAYGAIAIAVLLTVGYLAFERLSGSKPGGTAAAASIAVLPLANESGEADQRYFSDGISEDLITALSQLPGIKVIGRSSAFKFRDSKEDSHSIGAKLGVAHLLEGSVRRSGDLIRVSAELIDTADGSTQWSERYDRPYKDLFALQDEITRAVAVALRVKLLPLGQTGDESDRPPSGNIDAYNAMLQGRFALAHAKEAEVRKAIEYYGRAIELDPRYAFAWAKRAVAWAVLGGEYLDGAPAKEAYAKAHADSDRALALAPELAASHRCRGWLLQNLDLDWRGAEAEYRRALELAPNDHDTRMAQAVLLATLGQVNQAIAMYREGIAREPLQVGNYATLATFLVGVGRLDEAERATRLDIEQEPGATGAYAWLATLEARRGDAAAALAAARQEAAGPFRDIALALALQIGPDRSAADAALHTLIEKDADGVAYQIAEVYALRNDANNTFVWLEHAWSNRDPGLQTLLYDPFIPRFKADPRFAAFCRKVGLPVPGEGDAGKSV